MFDFFAGIGFRCNSAFYLFLNILKYLKGRVCHVLPLYWVRHCSASCLLSYDVFLQRLFRYIPSPHFVITNRLSLEQSRPLSVILCGSPASSLMSDSFPWKKTMITFLWWCSVTECLSRFLKVWKEKYLQPLCFPNPVCMSTKYIGLIDSG